MQKESVGTQQEICSKRTIIFSVAIFNSLSFENVVLGFAASQFPVAYMISNERRL